MGGDRVLHKAVVCRDSTPIAAFVLPRARGNSARFAQGLRCIHTQGVGHIFRMHQAVDRCGTDHADAVGHEHWMTRMPLNLRA